MPAVKFSCQEIKAASELALGRALYLSGFGSGILDFKNSFAQAEKVFELWSCSSIVWGGDDQRADSFTAFIAHILMKCLSEGRPPPVLLAFKFKKDLTKLDNPLPTWSDYRLELGNDDDKVVLEVPLYYIIVDENNIRSGSVNRYYDLAELIFELPWVAVVVSIGGGDTVLLEFSGICKVLRSRPLARLTWWVAPLPRTKNGVEDLCFLHRFRMLCWRLWTNYSG